jgi:hypothetical protein
MIDLEEKGIKELDEERRLKCQGILKNEIYEGIMKKFFVSGSDAESFSNLFLDENLAAAKAAIKNKSEDSHKSCY